MNGDMLWSRFLHPRKMRLWFKKRTKRKLLLRLCLCSLVLALFYLAAIVYLTINKVSAIVTCTKMIAAVNEQLCTSYQNGQAIGRLCEPLCSKRLAFVECPNLSGHNGKDYVFVAEWGGEKLVIKSRSLTTFELVGGVDIWKSALGEDRNLVVRTISDILRPYLAEEKQSEDSLVKMVPWEKHPKQLNQTELVNLYLLVQDNEFILSKLHSHLFPKIVGSCGHFYAVEFADEVLDFSYFFQLPFVGKQLAARIDVAIKIIDFLTLFQQVQPKLELCDVKYEHFGLINDNMLMIDSDMLYTNASVVRMIEAIPSCKRDDDCDFIDCKGICLATGKCVVDTLDDDIKRLCRNIFFMGRLFRIFSSGLLSKVSSEFQSEIDLIHDACFKRSNLKSDLHLIQKTLVEIKNKLSDSS